MRLTFWGAAQTVTGSKHLLELESGQRLLLDCGLFQGRREESERRNRNFGFAASDIDAVVLSHAHIDHAGLLPKLWKEGFRGRVYCTHATRSLAALLLMDSAYIQQKDVRFVNKIRRRKNQPPVDALYDENDAEGILRRFVTVGYDEAFEPLPGVRCVLRDAGHILGSATVNLQVTERGKTTRIGFTGDVGNPGRPILRDPQPMDDCDVLITESTYGGRTHEPPDRSKDRLAEVVTRTAERGGKVIIPAFSVGRTQEIVYALDQLWNENRLPQIPVYVDSPLAVNATGVYLAHPECYDGDLRRYLETDDDFLGFDRLTYVRKVEGSKAINATREPSVVISASGMCEAGRILHHLRNNIEDPRTTVMMVGYCAEHTLGKRLIDREKRVRIFGEWHDLKAEVVVMNSYSAHADEPGLVGFLSSLDRERLRHTFLVHGAPERQALMGEALRAKGFPSVRAPAHGEAAEM